MIIIRHKKPLDTRDFGRVEFFDNLPYIKKFRVLTNAKNKYIIFLYVFMRIRAHNNILQLKSYGSSVFYN